MITYLKPTRSRHAPASLTFRSRRSSLAEAMGWTSGLALSGVATAAAKDGVLALIEAFVAITPTQWIGGEALTVTALVLVFVVFAVLLKLGVARAMDITLNRERRRGAFASDLDAGPGLRGHPRLEP